MPATSVVFVHGFISSPKIWQPLIDRLSADADLPPQQYRWLTFAYPTAITELDPKKRLPTIADCGSALATFVDLRCPADTPVILVGHSMGGLVIQAMLAQRLDEGAGATLKRIRSVITLATPNRGSNFISTVRAVVSYFTRKNPQEESLRTLDDEIDRLGRKVERGILLANAVTANSCPISFQAFCGLQDAIVPRASAQGACDEVTAIPGDHSGILALDDGNRDDPEDMRYTAIKDALLHPLGHSSVYEIDLFEVLLAIEPASLDTTFTLRGLDEPKQVHTDNVATRTVRFQFSPKNRCHTPYRQMYRSDDGYVEFLTMNRENQATKTEQSTYRSQGKQFTYVFTPGEGDSFEMRLRVYNGFGAGHRNWHNHMEQAAHYRRVRFTLDLTKYAAAGYTLAPEPAFCYFATDTMDHELCNQREFGTPLTPLHPDSPWKRTWELTEVQGGVIDVSWDVKAPAAPAQV